MIKPVKTALISVFEKKGLDQIARSLHQAHCTILSTGGTQTYLESLGIPVVAVESLTGYPSILDGRVKTLHPKIFGGILSRTNHAGDLAELEQFGIPSIDLVVVDLYPFEETVKNGGSHEEIIEKIDIGGISLIRAAAKNYAHTLVVSDRSQYDALMDVLSRGGSLEEERKAFAAKAFAFSSRYDTLIHRYFTQDDSDFFRAAADHRQVLRYGENPHQKGYFYGQLDEIFELLNGKALSYNNLADAENALRCLAEFEEPTCVIIKHTNTCGLSSRTTLAEAYRDALACDPVSAFGGVIAVNRNVDLETAQLLHELFFEVLLMPGIEADALDLLKEKKNRILIQWRKPYGAYAPAKEYQNLLNGVLEQERDYSMELPGQWKSVTRLSPDEKESKDLLFAIKAVKHLKSNAIALVKNQQLIGMGCGMTSRIDALKVAIEKARQYGFDPAGAALASEAFFPFPDTVQAAHEAGISLIAQPGGSIKDQLSIDAADQNGQKMVFTGIRHFRH